MSRDEQLTFADHIGRFYARQYGFPPMVGRLFGYLLVCQPAKQSIDELSDALMASRSAIVGAVKSLESYQLVTRTRAAGERVDRVALRNVGSEPRNVDTEIFKEQAGLFREGLSLLDDSSPGRRAILEEMAMAAEFFGVRLPEVVEEWKARRAELRASGVLSEPDTD